MEHLEPLPSKVVLERGLLYGGFPKDVSSSTLHVCSGQFYVSFLRRYGCAFGPSRGDVGLEEDFLFFKRSESLSSSFSCTFPFLPPLPWFLGHSHKRVFPTSLFNLTFRNRADVPPSSPIK